MKNDQIPQDKIDLFTEKPAELQYAVDENGDYTQVKSVGWEPKNIAITQAWEEVEEKMEFAKEAILNNEKSPIFYFMHKNIMDVKILAEYTGFFWWTVMRHLKPKGFSKLSDKKLEKYREAFNLSSIKELKDFKIETREK